MIGLCYGRTRTNHKATRREETMAAYVIYNQLEVTDQDAWAEYGSKIREQMADYGGRILAAEPNATPLMRPTIGFGFRCIARNRSASAPRAS